MKPMACLPGGSALATKLTTRPTGIVQMTSATDINANFRACSEVEHFTYIPTRAGSASTLTSPGNFPSHRRKNS
jgi:hypothetical protein